MANHAFIVDSHQAELRNECGRLAQSLNETRFVWPTECQLIDLEDFLMIPRSLRPDRDHAPCLACVHPRVGVEHQDQLRRSILPAPSAASCCSTASANPCVAHPGNRATTFIVELPPPPRQWSRSPARRASPTNTQGRRVSHENLSTPEACKGRDAPFSALALRTDLGQSTHFHAPRTGRGAALGLRHEAPARIFTIPNPNGIRVCASGP
jgi:hypothetical protein